MGDPSALREDERAARQAVPSREAAELASLREILVGPERRDIAALTARVNDARGRAEDLAEVLPAVLLQHTQDPQFTRALAPPIEKAITTSVQRNPKPLADALFPVMGPAIRKAVSAAMAGMVESLNRTLEHSLSLRSFRWRLEGWRTGKSFAEVVLAKTLVFRVEQVFLIDRRAGLLLQHVHAADLDVPDADMVSGLLTAIRDFAKDAFKVSGEASLDAFQVGDLSVIVEAGPMAMLAAVVRGVAPLSFRRTLAEAVESIHLQFGEALEAFNGDTSVFEDARSALAGCLETVYQPQERKPRRAAAWVLIALVGVALAAWAGFRYRDGRRFDGYLERLRAEPGIVVVNGAREGRRFVVSGLVDPLARRPETLLEGTGLAPERVVGRWAPYQALEPQMILARAASMLRPPQGVTLSLEAGTLFATGRPPIAWVEEAIRLAAFVPGVTRFDAARSVEAAVRAAISSIEERIFLFEKGSAELTSADTELLDGLTADVQELNALAAVAGTRFGLEVVGHTDADGPDVANVPLSEARARVVQAAIESESLPGVVVTIRGVGSSQPAVTGDGESANQRNRRVAIQVIRLGPDR